MDMLPRVDLANIQIGHMVYIPPGMRYLKGYSFINPKPINDGSPVCSHFSNPYQGCPTLDPFP
jgi:hypothetical protein